MKRKNKEGKKEKERNNQLSWNFLSVSLIRNGEAIFTDLDEPWRSQTACCCNFCRQEVKNLALSLRN